MEMNSNHEVLVSARDAEALAAIVGDRGIANGSEHAAAGALADSLMEARLVPDGELPANRVAMNTRVTYRDGEGAHRTVCLVHPKDADPARLRISVLSPVGRALLGRRRGSTITATLPGGRGIELHIVAVEPAASSLGKEA
jgi:regulator of nucleoside diphosphate kinase